MLQISQKTFLLTGLALFVLAGAVIFTLHDRALDPEKTGSWWAVRFASLDDASNLTFEVENHGEFTVGSYEIYADGTLRERQDFRLEEPVTSLAPTTSQDGAHRVRILIKLGDEEKSLTR